MQTGKVKWFNDQKGYGFITPDAGGPEVFVHYSVIEGRGRRTLQDGQGVQFEATRGDKGVKATRVCIAS